MGKLDKPTLVGLGLCAASLAAFSAYSQFETASMAGVPKELAWILPVTTDATAFVSTRVWLTPHYSRSVRDYAAFITLVCIGLSFGGAAAHLAFLDQGMPWWMRLLVGGLPSLALAALVHLVALIAADGKAPAKTAQTKKPKAAPQAAGGAERNRPPTSSAPSVSTPDISTETGSDLQREPDSASSVANPEVGEGSVRQRMLAHLDECGEVSGAELDRLFGTKNYGRGVVRAWRKAHPQASGE